VVTKQQKRFPIGPGILKNRAKVAKQEATVQQKAAKAGLAPMVLRQKGRTTDMMMVRGKTLQAKLPNSSGRMQYVYGKRVGKGLRKLHDKGIAHQDLHDRNVLITPTGKVKIIDYGKAKDYGNRPLSSRERRGDYAKLVNRSTNRGRTNKRFREGFTKAYAPYGG
jgi:tRNA A-37 threonylcarbamoyl transferase component Bud32